MRNLNIGSGDTKLDGFISVDLYDETADVRADICELPFEDGSISQIICYQVIEHCPYNKSQDIFDELYRVLKKGGTAIVETPDIDYVCQAILREGLREKWIFNLVGEYYRPWDKDRYKDWENVAAAIHRNPWNYKRLEEHAWRSGFDVTRLDLDMMQSKFKENLAVCLTK